MKGRNMSKHEKNHLELPQESDEFAKKLFVILLFSTIAFVGIAFVYVTP